MEGRLGGEWRVLLVVHLYKERRIIIDLFMDRLNRERPMEMRQTVDICRDILGMCRDPTNSLAAESESFCRLSSFRTSAVENSAPEPKSGNLSI